MIAGTSGAKPLLQARDALAEVLNAMGETVLVCEKPSGARMMSVRRLQGNAGEPGLAKSGGPQRSRRVFAKFDPHRSNDTPAPEPEFIIVTSDDAHVAATAGYVADAIVLTVDLARTTQRKLMQTAQSLDPTSERIIAIVAFEKASSELSLFPLRQRAAA
jgi:hypothetical protein